jgi:hypothetical protein
VNVDNLTHQTITLTSNEARRGKIRKWILKKGDLGVYGIDRTSDRNQCLPCEHNNGNSDKDERWEISQFVTAL